MKQLVYSSAAVLAALLLAQCRHQDPDPDPASLLPPATQTGARTFGCLVNGQAYLPEGRVGLGSNFNVSYDPTWQGGDLIVSSYRATASERKNIMIGGNSISRTGTYAFGPTTTLRTFFTDQNGTIPCNNYDNRNAGTFCKGTLTITRLDLREGVVSGTFAYVLAKPGCDTLRVTQGRFDEKL